ncbi:MAG TPA: helix-turn-helix domain-containing protein [Ktedonobacteraceae bacterium]|nr:helix-turn-helix domain-containing protein [Ktedonobacteraceae bacterium]
MDHGGNRTFKNIVRQERLRRGWSQADLAEKVGVTAATVHRWENGKTLPQSFPRQRLCELFEKTPEALDLFREAQEEIDDEMLRDASHQSKLASGNASTIFPKDITGEDSPLLLTDKSSRDMAFAHQSEVDLHLSGLHRPAEDKNDSPTLIPSSSSIDQLSDSHTASSSIVIKERHFSRRTVLSGAAALGLVAIGSVSWWTFSPHPPSNLLYVYRGHSDLVTSVVWSPDGKRIASGSYDHTVQVWHALSRSRVLVYRGHHNDVVTAVGWSPNAHYIASGADHSVQIWNPASGSHILTYDQGLVAPVAWSPDCTCIVLNGPGYTLQVWSALNRSHILTCVGHISYVWCVSWSPNGEYIASGSVDSTVWIWNADNAKPLLVYRGHSAKVHCVAWSPDSRYIASASDDGTVKLWDIANGNTILTYRGHSGSVRSTSWSPNGKYLASGGTDSTVQIWSSINGSHISTYRGHLGIVRGVAWSPDSELIASCGDPTVQVWNPM